MRHVTLAPPVVCYAGSPAHKCRASVKEHYSRTVTICEAAVVGAGIGLALIGAVEIAAAITLHPWAVEMRHYGDYLLLFGGMVGATAGWIFTRRL